MSSGPLWAFDYFRARLPPTRLLLPLCVAFGCAWTIFATPLGGHSRAWSSLPPGAATFVLLLAQLRLVDDLDDLESDHPQSSDEAVEARRALGWRLKLSLVVIAAGLLLLNLHSVRTLGAVVTASALAYAGPFVIKRLCPPRAPFLALAFLVFEGAPAAIFAYAYYSSGPEPQVGPAVALAVTTSFWLGYEFWKFSRKAHRDTLQPYFLRRAGLRLALSTMLVMATFANGAVAQLAHLGVGALLYLTALPIAVLCWMSSRWVADTSGKSGGSWAGMTYLVLLELGILFGLLTSRPAV